MTRPLIVARNSWATDVAVSTSSPARMWRIYTPSSTVVSFPGETSAMLLQFDGGYKVGASLGAIFYKKLRTLLTRVCTGTSGDGYSSCGSRSLPSAGPFAGLLLTGRID